MPLQRMLPFLELEALALRLGVVIRSEPSEKGVARRAGGGGAPCRRRGKPVIVMDASLALADKVAVLAAALGRFDLWDALGPSLRSFALASMPLWQAARRYLPPPER